MQIKQFFLPLITAVLLIGIVACTKDSLNVEKAQQLSQVQTELTTDPTDAVDDRTTLCGSIRLRVNSISNTNHRFVMSIRNKATNQELIAPISTQNCPLPGGLGFTVNYAIGNNVFFSAPKNSKFIIRLASVNNINCTPVGSGTSVNFEVQGPSVSPPYANPVFTRTLTFMNGSPVAETEFSFDSNCQVVENE